MSTRTVRMHATPQQAADILTRVGYGTPCVTNKDFEVMGYSFEHFLTYASLEGRYLKMAHDRLRTALKEKAAEDPDLGYHYCDDCDPQYHDARCGDHS